MDTPHFGNLFHSAVDGHLICFHFFGDCESYKIDMNNPVQVTVRICVFMSLGQTLRHGRSGLKGLCSVLALTNGEYQVIVFLKD